jgi:hypothetical protein
LLFTITFGDLPSDLYFFKLTQPLTVSTVQLLCTVKEKRGEPDRKSYPIPYDVINAYTNLKSRLCPETSTKLYVHEFGFLYMTVWCVGSSKSPVYVKNTLEEESPLSSDIISLTGGLVDLDKPFRYLSFQDYGSNRIRIHFLD